MRNRYSICEQYLASAARSRLPNPITEAQLISQWGSCTAKAPCVRDQVGSLSANPAPDGLLSDDTVRVPTACILATIVANALWEDLAYRRNVPRLLFQLAHQQEAIDVIDVRECLHLVQHNVDFDDLILDVPHARK